MGLQEYLAAHYMSGPKADAILARSSTGQKKKKKRKAVNTLVEGSVTLREEDAWGGALGGSSDEEDSGAAAIADPGPSTFKKAASAWATVHEGEGGPPAEEEAPEQGDEKPLVVEEAEPVRGGLKTAKQLRAENAARRAAEAALEPTTAGPSAAEQETVYRDPTGRKIDMKAAALEERRRKQAAEEAEARKMEWGKGLVQRDEKERRRREQEALVDKPLARYATDADMNAELREVERWNDPAAAFLTRKSTSKGPQKPKYKGPPPPPNRFGIQPGYRWDGVDRSTGFEAKLFQSQNSKKRARLEHQMWSQEDM